jgi:hypothetical protein
MFNFLLFPLTVRKSTGKNKNAVFSEYTGATYSTKIGGEIMKNFIILLLTAFILSCTTAPQISDDRFLSSRPNLQVQYHKPIVEKSEKSQRYQHGDFKSYHFHVNSREGVLIQIYE